MANTRKINPRSLAATTGQRSRVLLGQLAGWAAGHAAAFEIEARLKADAEARARAASRGRPGFT